MDLRVESPSTSDQFAAALRALDINPPVEQCADQPAAVVDANNVLVCMVDPDGEITNDEAGGIAALIVVALNTCGGFRVASAGAQ